jgi:hypothetical protein
VVLICIFVLLFQPENNLLTMSHKINCWENLLESSDDLRMIWLRLSSIRCWRGESTWSSRGETTSLRQTTSALAASFTDASPTTRKRIAVTTETKTKLESRPRSANWYSRIHHSPLFVTSCPNIYLQATFLMSLEGSLFISLSVLWHTYIDYCYNSSSNIY